MKISLYMLNCAVALSMVAGASEGSSARAARTIDLGGTWHVASDGIDADIALPGTLCQPGDTITSTKGLADGHDFRMPLTRKRGEKSFAEVDVDHEDLLDGKIEIEIRQLTGQNFRVDRIRVVPK